MANAVTISDAARAAFGLRQGGDGDPLGRFLFRNSRPSGSS